MNTLPVLDQEAEFILDRSVRLHGESERFRHYLLQFTAADLDACFTTASRNVSPRINCMKCAACCRGLEPELSQKEFEILGGLLNGQTAPGFLSIPSHDGGAGRNYLSSPCKFLAANRCGIYEQRPLACAGYPHLEEKGIRFRLRTVFEQAARCPIVFHVIEQLKLTTGFTSTSS